MSLNIPTNAPATISTKTIPYGKDKEVTKAVKTAMEQAKEGKLSKAKVIYNGRSWTFDGKAPSSKTHFYDTFVHAIKMIFSTIFSTSYQKQFNEAIFTLNRASANFRTKTASFASSIAPPLQAAPSEKEEKDEVGDLRKEIVAMQEKIEQSEKELQVIQKREQKTKEIDDIKSTIPKLAEWVKLEESLAIKQEALKKIGLAEKDPRLAEKERRYLKGDIDVIANRLNNEKIKLPEQFKEFSFTDINGLLDSATLSLNVLPQNAVSREQKQREIDSLKKDLRGLETTLSSFDLQEKFKADPFAKFKDSISLLSFNQFADLAEQVLEKTPLEGQEKRMAAALDHLKGVDGLDVSEVDSDTLELFMKALFDPSISTKNFNEEWITQDALFGPRIKTHVLENKLGALSKNELDALLLEKEKEFEEKTRALKEKGTPIVRTWLQKIEDSIKIFGEIGEQQLEEIGKLQRQRQVTSDGAKRSELAAQIEEFDKKLPEAYRGGEASKTLALPSDIEVAFQLLVKMPNVDENLTTQIYSLHKEIIELKRARLPK